MASSTSILLWPLGSLLPSGSLNDEKCAHGTLSQRPSVVCRSRRKGGADHERAKLNNVTRQMRLLLESEGLLAHEAAGSLVNSMKAEGRTALISALFPATERAMDFFQLADTNSDGVVDAAEFACFVESQAYFFEDSNKPLTNDQVFHLGTRAAIGMIGFGFTDNAIMILAGDVIQNTIGLTLGLSTLMSAGFGNAIADLLGTAFRGYIDRMSGSFMPALKMTARQLESREAWWAETVGASAGVTLGCLLGLSPLLFLPQRHELETAATPTSVISQSPETVVHCSQPSGGVSSNGGTVFATISTSGSPCEQPHGHSLAQTVVGSVFILMVTTAMAVKRVQEFLRTRRKLERL